MQSAQVLPSQVRRESDRRLRSRSSPCTFEPTHFLVGRIRASGWFAACFRDARFESACVLTAGRQPYCRGRACPGGGDEDETIRRACKNPVNPILLGSASPLALQVRMGAGSHGAGTHDRRVRPSILRRVSPAGAGSGARRVPIKVLFSRAGVDAIQVRVKTSLRVKHAVVVNPGG